MRVTSLFYLLVVSCLAVLQLPCAAQRRIAADVEIKQVAAGRSTTVTKTVYCSRDGRLVTDFHKPVNYITAIGPRGEGTMYMPSTGEYVNMPAGDVISARDNLLSLYLSGQLSDFGLTRHGYVIADAVTEPEGYVRKVFRNDNSLRNGGINRVDIVYDQRYLPVYFEYFSSGGALARKVYLSHYITRQGVTMPLRMTGIEYNGADSTIVRTLYSNIRIDQDDPMFDFTLPADAKPAERPK